MVKRCLIRWILAYRTLRGQEGAGKDQESIFPLGTHTQDIPNMCRYLYFNLL